MACREQRRQDFPMDQLPAWRTFTYIAPSGVSSQPYLRRSRQYMKRQQSALIKLIFMNDSPLISIVTPSLNQASFIGEALQSVERQSYANWEHLVMDGMSTDGTVDLLRDMTSKNKQHKLSWVSERDSGQSDALNKGF